MGIKRRQTFVDRRSFLKTAIGSGAVLNAIGSDISGFSPHAVPTQENKEIGRIIDTHIHLVRGNPDLKPIGDYGSRMTDVPDEAKAEYLKREMAQAGIGSAFGMGHRNGSKDDPLGIVSTLRIAARAPGLKVIGVIDPAKTGREHLLSVERQIERERNKIVAFKAYLGYLNFGPEAPGYAPYYKLAAKYNLPVIFHTGDVWSLKAKVKYAHPLLVDEVAVDHPSVNFVLAHFGNPWFSDAAEVVWKNDNVWVDLSGLYMGDEKSIEEIIKSGTLPEAIPGLVISDLKKAITALDRYDRILYASDWPFLPMIIYRKFVEVLIPSAHYEKVFRANAEALFKLKA